jgi:hypothetical protein
MSERLNDTKREKADDEAVLRHAFHGEPFDSEVARRVRERGEAHCRYCPIINRKEITR